MSASSAIWNSLMKSGAGRVHRPEADQPFADVETPDELHDPVRQVDELDALIGLR